MVSDRPKGSTSEVGFLGLRKRHYLRGVSHIIGDVSAVGQEKIRDLLDSTCMSFFATPPATPAETSAVSCGSRKSQESQSGLTPCKRCCEIRGEMGRNLGKLGEGLARPSPWVDEGLHTASGRYARGVLHFSLSYLSTGRTTIESRKEGDHDRVETH